MDHLHWMRWKSLEWKMKTSDRSVFVCVRYWCLNICLEYLKQIQVIMVSWYPCTMLYTYYHANMMIDANKFNTQKL